MIRIGVVIGGLLLAVMIMMFGFELRMHDDERGAVATTSPVQATVAAVVTIATTTAAVAREVVTPPERGWKRGIATVFWVGEGATDDNGYISNSASAWDTRWQEHYGGIDSPENRCGYQSCTFVPRENPFYVALPYSDLNDDGSKKANAVRIPWNDATRASSVLKNRWIEVRHQGTTCYGQWQDVGPFEEDDIEYVFGDAQNPLNQYGEKAGIDLSPALAQCLGIDGSDTVEWRHVDTPHVPPGPWQTIVTTRS